MKSTYYRQPYHSTLVNRIKKDINDAVNVLFGDYTRIQKARAVGKLIRLIPVILNDMPEPTVENNPDHNTRILIGHYERFFRRLKIPSHSNILRAIWKLIIIIHATDFYRQFINDEVEELRKSDWKDQGPLQPDPHFWKQEED